jgi:hypothetical protein
MVLLVATIIDSLLVFMKFYANDNKLLVIIVVGMLLCLPSANVLDFQTQYNIGSYIL